MKKLTPNLISAIGADAANEQMHKNGRTHWSIEDFNVAVSTTDPLWQEYYHRQEINTERVPT